MKFRTLLLLFGTIPFLTTFNANGNGIVSLNDQQKRITGHIVDSKGIPLTGVNIVEKNTTNGILSDVSGNYALNVASGNSVLVFTFIGFTPQEVTVGSQTNINVTLLESTLALDEVVVVGYGSQKKATITGSISAIESAKLLQSPVVNISNSLNGRVSGLLSTQVSGAPGQDAATLRIRGVGTFAGTTDPLVMVDGIEAQNYNNIDPNEIETISILKDASATAVYGVRGANGVLLITTKRGKLGKPQVTFTSQVAMTKFTDLRQYAGSYVWATEYNEARHYDSYLTGAYLPVFTDADLQAYKDKSDPIFHPDVDWVNLMLKPQAMQVQDNLNISGGTEKVKYFFSVGYMGQGGLWNENAYDAGYDAKNQYNRYNFRSNFDFIITKRLTAKINLSSQIENLAGTMGDKGATTNMTAGSLGSSYMMSNIMATAPNASPGILDGKIVNLTTTSSSLSNPLTQVFGAGLVRDYNNYLNGTVRFDYALDMVTKGLSVHGMTSYQNFNSVHTTYSRTVVTYLVLPTGGGNYVLGPQNQDNPFTFGQSYGKTRRQDFEFGFDYTRNFGTHNFGGFLLYNQSKTYDPGLQYVVPHGFQGVVGRVTYDYDKRYLAEFDFGYNGTENFAPGKRFGFFPAYSVGWVVSEEPFFPKSRTISYVKLRGSYGEVGNDRVGGSRFLYNPTSYTYTSNAYRFGEVPGTFAAYTKSNEGLVGNPDLTWEVAKKLDVGLDLTLFKDHLKITADYFDERRDNILTTPGTYPDMIGATFPAYNIGKMKNNGADGEINFNSNIGKFNYWVKGVFTYTHNVVEYMAEAKKAWPYQQATGLRYGQVFGMVAEGYYNTWEQVNDAVRPMAGYNSNRIQPGDFIYKDVNGDGIVDSNDAVPIGYSAFPERTYGLSFGGDFKGFDFSVLFQAATANTHLASKKFKYGYDSGGSMIAYLADRSWAWEKYEAGIKTDFPHISSSNSQAWNYLSNTKWQENDNYVRLKNFEIGYSMSLKPLKKIGIGSLRIYANGSNLFTWCSLFPGEDPEIPTYSDGNYEPYPVIRTFNVGINIKF